MRRSKGGLVDSRPVRGRDERHPGFPKGPLPGGGLLLSANQSGHPGHHEEEQGGRRGGDHGNVHRSMTRGLQGHHRRGDERRQREQRESAFRQPRIDLSCRLRKCAHRGMQGGGTKQQIEECPPTVQQPSGCISLRDVEQDPAVDRVGHDQRDRAPGEEVEGSLTLSRTHGQSGHERQNQHVRQRVGDGDQLQRQAETGVMRVGSHEVDPGDEPDADRDDEGVDQASPVATGRTAADQEQDSADEAWVDAQVQGVGDGGERKRAAEEPLVVVCDDVPGH